MDHAPLSQEEKVLLMNDFRVNLTSIVKEEDPYVYPDSIDAFLNSGSEKDAIELAFLFQRGRITDRTLVCIFQCYSNYNKSLTWIIQYKALFGLMNRTPDCQWNHLIETIQRIQEYVRVETFVATSKVNGWSLDLFCNIRQYHRAIGYQFPKLEDHQLLREYIDYLRMEKDLFDSHIGMRICKAFTIERDYDFSLPNYQIYEQFNQYESKVIANVCDYILSNYSFNDRRVMFSMVFGLGMSFNAFCVNPYLIRTWFKERRQSCSVESCSGCQENLAKAINHIVKANSDIIRFNFGGDSEALPGIVIGWRDNVTHNWIRERDVNPATFNSVKEFNHFHDQMVERTSSSTNAALRAERAKEEKEEKERNRRFRKQEKELKKLFLAAIRSMGTTSHPAGITKSTISRIVAKALLKRDEYLEHKSFSKEGQRATSFELELTNAKRVSNFLMLEHIIYALGGDVVRDGSVSATERQDRWEFECVGRPLPKEEYDNFLNIFCSALKLVGAKSNESCGLHIHVDASDFEDKNLRRMVKIWQTVEPAMFALCAEHRQDNRYAQAVKRTLNKCLKTDKSFGELFYGGESELRYAVDSHYMNERYYAINFHSFFYHDRKSIEFRLKEATTNELEIRCWTDICRILVESAKSMSKEEVHLFSQEEDSYKALMMLISHDLRLVQYVNNMWKQNKKFKEVTDEEDTIGTLIDEVEEPVNNAYADEGHEYDPSDDYNIYDASLAEVEEELVRNVRDGQVAIRRLEGENL